MNIFVTGTDTGIGKTTVSAWICAKTNAMYWKPIQTGDDSDSDTVYKFAPKSIILQNAYHLKAPLSAYDAARIENVNIDINQIIKQCPQNRCVIEGAGGALVPITADTMMADLILPLKAKALIVAKSQLGFLNHIFMTVEVLKQRNIPIIGIVLNGETELIETIEQFSQCRVIAVLKDLNDMTLLPIPNEILEQLI